MNPQRQRRQAREQARLADVRRRTPSAPSAPSAGEPIDLDNSVAGEEDPGASLDLGDAPAGGRGTDEPNRGPA